MNNNKLGTEEHRQEQATGPQSGLEYEQRRAELEARLSRLESEADRWRVRQDLRELDLQRVARINEQLANDDAQVMRLILAQRALCLSMAEAFDRESNRRDLTVPETMLLAKQAQRNRWLLAKTFEREAELISRRLSGRR